MVLDLAGSSSFALRMSIASTAERPGGILLHPSRQARRTQAQARVARACQRAFDVVVITGLVPAAAAIVFRTSIRLLVFALAAGCSGSLPHPPYSRQTSASLVVVDSAPPPCRIEQVPERPKGATAWVNGEWIRRHGRWYWLVGRWVTTPAGWTYSPWVFVRAEDGTAFYAPSAWKDEHGVAMAAPQPLAFATAGGSSVVDPEGNPVAIGRNLQTAPAPPIAPSASAGPAENAPPSEDP